MTKRTLLDLEGEYAIRLMDMPPHAHGIVVYDDEGFANVYINAHLTAAQQKDAADHELDHIAHDDINSDEDIRAVEARADLTRAIPALKRAADLVPKPDLPAAPPFDPGKYLREYDPVLAVLEDRWLQPDE